MANITAPAKPAPLSGKGRFWRLRESIPCLFLALALLTAMTCSGCTEEKHPPPQPPRPEMVRIAELLERHYRTSPPGNEWKVTSVTTQGNLVLINAAIPADKASEIKRRPADGQFRMVAEQVCPRKDHDVWRLLPADSAIKVLPGVSGQVFIEVDCIR